MNVRGTIYLPDGDAETFDALGNGGDILTLKEARYIHEFTVAALVE